MEGVGEVESFILLSQRLFFKGERRCLQFRPALLIRPGLSKNEITVFSFPKSI